MQTPQCRTYSQLRLLTKQQSENAFLKLNREIIHFGLMCYRLAILRVVDFHTHPKLKQRRHAA